MSVRVPTTLKSIGLAVAACMSLWPGSLPRGPLAQAVLTTVCVVLALVAVRLVGTRRGPRRSPVVAGAATCVIAACVIREHLWQNIIRGAMDVPRIPLHYWPTVLVLVVAASAVVLQVPRVLRRASTTPIRVMSVAVVAVGVLLSFTGPSTATDSVGGVTAARSGSAVSLIPWSTLDEHGQRVVTGGATPDTIRVYAGLHSGPDPRSRADLAVDELDRVGAFDRNVLVVAVPTGSGWVDEAALSEVDARLGTRAATVSVQYSDSPSWLAYLTERDRALDATSALLTAITDRLSHRAIDQRPDVVVYGQSLGAWAARAALDAAPRHVRSAVCGTVSVGPPPAERPGPSPVPDTVVSNASDPVPTWSPSTIVDPPRRDSRVRSDSPLPSWFPVLSFASATADLILATGAPAGHGHRYGPEQGAAIVDQTADGCGNSPRAAS
ncbi:alpha/beta-hydrolase family protein [Rhodococcus sp. MEB041]|uniref:alpha/beta-hydrolase family protein n=1 Tax=Rhodococcus sp. MEB041 TaxID=3040323 RepID=UPI00254A6182|nr:alpha/beta-hydrolase family protein [Rhodococcus sp. MEB041]